MKLFGIGLGMNAATIALGAAAVMFGPVLLAAAGSAAKPLFKAGIKGGLLLYDKSKQLALEAKESLEDLAAEAKAEIEEPPKQRQAKKAA
jgi:hypothetical protein